MNAKELKALHKLAADHHEYHGDRYLAMCAFEGLKEPPPVAWFTSVEGGELVTTCEILWDGAPSEVVRFPDFYADYAVFVLAAIRARLSKN